jgi:hypothetical protein
MQQPLRKKTITMLRFRRRFTNLDRQQTLLAVVSCDVTAGTSILQLLSQFLLLGLVHTLNLVKALLHFAGTIRLVHSEFVVLRDVL